MHSLTSLRHRPCLVVCLLLYGLLSLYNIQPATAQAYNDPPWRILSPTPDAVVQNGELFVVVALNEGVRLDPASVSIALDGDDMTRTAKVSESTVRLLYLRDLADGHHELRVLATDQEGEELPELQWHFTINGGALPATAGRRPASRRAFVLSGQTALDTRNADISGQQSLRQEPPSTYAVSVDMAGQYGGLTFPVRVYATTDDDSQFQSRNRYLVGLQSKHLTLLVGDNTPDYGTLMLNYARVRGLHGEVHLGPLHLSGMRGALRRGIAPDVEAFIFGTFERNVTALRLGLGSPRSVLFGINAIKATDDSTSVPFRTLVAGGLKPQQNLVVGPDLSIRMLKGRLRLEGGAAFSVLTEDITRGAVTKAEADSLFDTNLPLDPADLEGLIVLNASTVPLRLDKLSSLSWYGKTRASAWGHTLTAEYQSVGSAYFSFGNPFLQNDRTTFTVADRFKVLDGKVSGSVRFRRYGTPPRADALIGTLKADLFSTQVVLAPWRSPTWFYAGLRLQQRASTADGSGDPLTDTQLQSFSVGGYHLLRTGRYQHGLNVSATLADRKDLLREELSNTTHSVAVGLHEQLPIPLYINTQLSLLQVTGETISQDLTTLSAKLGYRFRERGLNVAVSGQATQASFTSLFNEQRFEQDSDRFTATLQAIYQIRSDMDLELQLGHNTYRETQNPDNRYTERFIVLRHRYIF